MCVCVKTAVNIDILKLVGVIIFIYLRLKFVIRVYNKKLHMIVNYRTVMFFFAAYY